MTTVTSRLPARPPISAPGAERAVAAGAFRRGLRGLWLVVPIAALLAVGAGGAERSLLVLGPLVTAALPVIAMVAFWWEDWPGTRLRPSWSGWADTVLIAAGAVVLAAVAQAVVGGLDLRGLFDPSPGPGHVPTFPATLPLLGAAFVVMLQLTLVGEGWPLRRLPALAAGPLAVAASWALALVVYLALVGVEPPPGSGVSPRDGPVPGADLGAALVWIGAWQVLCFVVWRGWPSSRLASRATRLPCAHALVLGGGLLTFLAIRVAVDAPASTAAGGCFVTAGLLVGMLFEAGEDRLAGAAASLLLAAALFAGLSALGDAFGLTGPRADDWVAHASLNAIAVSTILHVAVGRRWPFG
jgi:hypothetical protein